MFTERSFLTDDPSLSGDSWYKHVIVSPSTLN